MYTAIRAASETLRVYLHQQLAADIQTFNTVSLNNPQEMQDGGTQGGLSWWLYRIVRDEQRLNAPPRRLSRSRYERVPLPFRLHYLATPIVNFTTPGSPLTEQEILGRVLQAFHDHPVLRGADLQDDLGGTEVELTVRLETMGLEEITRVWEALDKPYQLSVSYEVGVVPIHSQREPEEAAPVVVALPDYGAIAGSEPA